MSQNDSIKQLLNIQDPNIQILQVSTENKKGQTCKLISAYLSYSPPDCDNCLKKMVKNGFTSSDILLLPSAAYKTILRLRKQRFKCQDCGRSALAKTDIVHRKHQISKQVHLRILELLLRKRSMTEIAFDFGISIPTVARRLKALHFKRPSVLPEILSFDEFKAFGSSMAFNLLDAQTHQILDVLPSRKLNELEDYFYQFSREQRLAVKRVVVDMYRPYFSLIKKLFPKADIVIDRFHIYQQLNKAFNGTRIDLMKKFQKSSKEYRHLKRYWKLLLLNKTRLEHSNYHYHASFKTYLSESEIVYRLLSYSPELKHYYELYQRATHLLDMKAPEKFFDWLDSELHQKGLNERVKTTFKTFKTYRNSLTNSLRFSESNGPIEGANNHIKVLKRIAYGYRNFDNFRNRILLVLASGKSIQENKSVIDKLAT